MVRIDVSFLLLAVLCLVCGVVMGIGMGIAHDFQLAPVHAHLNLVGFMALSVFGLTYKAYPALQRSRLALPHLVASSIGAVVFPVGIYLSINFAFPIVAIVAAFFVLGGVLMFLANLVRNVVLSPAPARAPLGATVPWAA